MTVECRQIPEDSISLLLTRWKEASGEEELPPEQDNVVKEHLSVRAFMVSGTEV